MRKDCDLLVVGAHLPEIAALKPFLSTPKGHRVVETTVGIGLSAAAVGTTWGIAAALPRAVIFVGTCGAYAGERALRIGELAIARTVKLVAAGAIDGLAAFPGPMELSLESDPSMRDGLVAAGGATPADVATTLAVTTDDALAARICAATSCAVEHLEAHAVATACNAAGVPFAAVLGVANHVGSCGRAEWQANHQASSDAAVAHLIAWLEKGAPGLSV